MSEEDVIERWLQRGWERLRGVTGRGARTDLSPLSTEAYDLLRQVCLLYTSDAADDQGLV